MNLDTLIETKRVGEEVIPVIDLRGLHKLLEVKRKFADWAKDKVKHYTEGEHYVMVPFSNPTIDKNGKKHVSTSKEYYVSLEIAKSVVKDRPALVEFFETRLPPQEPPPFDIKALHKLLGIGTRLNEWVSRRIKERGFEEGIHYHKQNNTYTFSEKALKELLLSERCEKSREALKAFLDREEKQTAALQSIENITLDLSKTLVHFNGEDIYLSSLDIASTTGKMHKNVIRDIEEEKAKLGAILADMGDRLRFEPISENPEKLEAIQEILNGFKEDSYVDSNGRRQKAYNLTEGAATQILLRYSPEARAYFITMNTMTNEASEIKAKLLERDEKATKIINSFSKVEIDFSGSILSYKDGDLYITSLAIASLTGKDHRHVLRDIREEALKLQEEIDLSKSGLISGNEKEPLAYKEILRGVKESHYLDEQGRRYPCYELSESAAYQMMLKYSFKFRALVIYEFQQMRKNLMKMLQVSLIENVYPELAVEKQHVYVIRNTLTENLKIGVSKDPEKRLAALQTGSDAELTLEYKSIACSNALQIEAEVHKLLKDYHVRGEWFSASLEQVEAALSRVSYQLSLPPLEFI